jgi:hypothetical protein
MLQHLHRRLNLRIVPNIRQQHRIRVRHQLTITLNHMPPGNRINLPIDHPQRHLPPLHGRHPSIPLLPTLRNIRNQLVQNPRPILALDQAPEIIQRTLTGPSRRPENLQLGAGVLMAEMLLFFIPALMSLLDYGGLVKHDGWRIMLVIGFSTLSVMLVTAFTVEFVCRWKLRHEA